MGRIREYQAMSSVGDPFRFRLPKIGLKKSTWRKIGHAASGALGFVGQLSSFVPVMGPVLGKVFNRAMQLAQNVPGGQERLLDFARGYGFDVGDPGPKHVARRKMAAAGTHVKSKRMVTSRAGSKHHKSVLSGINWGKIGGKLLGGIPIVGGAADEAVQQLSTPAGNDDAANAMLAALQGGAVPGIPPIRGGKKARGFGGHHRRINPANVKALRRSVRRLEGFEHLVKKVMPHLVTKHRATSHSSGHKHGCKCVACKHRRAA